MNFTDAKKQIQFLKYKNMLHFIGENIASFMLIFESLKFYMCILFLAAGPQQQLLQQLHLSYGW